jgi:hypothetical protein
MQSKAEFQLNPVSLGFLRLPPWPLALKHLTSLVNLGPKIPLSKTPGTKDFPSLFFFLFFFETGPLSVA